MTTVGVITFETPLFILVMVPALWFYQVTYKAMHALDDMLLAMLS